MAIYSISAVDPASYVRNHARGAIAAAALWASLVLGGGTKAGFLADAVIQLLAVALVVLLLMRPIGGAAREHKRELALASAIIMAFVATIVLQLVPLPPELWMKLTGRARWADLPEFTGTGAQWRPLSLAPAMTWLALMSLVPPIVVFWATATSDLASRRALVASVVVFASFSAMLGLVQVAQGEASSLRPFEFTNRNEAVGLFANRNHLAALLYSALVLLFPWAAFSSTNLVAAIGSRRSVPTSVVLAAVAAFTLIVILMSGQAITRSRAGLGLTALAIVGGVLLTLAVQQGEKLRAARVPMAAVLLALIFALQFTLYRNLERFDGDPLADARLPYAQNTWTAIQTLFPFGAGVGSFVEVYGSFERLRDLHVTYANRAHNDFLEAALELGLPGLVVIAAFLLWFLWRSVAGWRGDGPKREPLDLMIVRAGAIVIVLVMAHSFVDYPLRTGAISALFALCCGLLVRPPHNPDDRVADHAPTARSRAHAHPRLVRRDPELDQPPVFARFEAPPAPPPSPMAATKPPPLPALDADRRWGDDVQWPGEWQTREPSPSAERASPTAKTSWEDAIEKFGADKPPKEKS